MPVYQEMGGMGAGLPPFKTSLFHIQSTLSVIMIETGKSFFGYLISIRNLSRSFLKFKELIFFLICTLFRVVCYRDIKAIRNSNRLDKILIEQLMSRLNVAKDQLLRL
jgi:hypothetical protein